MLDGMYVGVIVGRGIIDHVPIVLWRYLRDDYVKKVLIAMPEGKEVHDIELFHHPKLEFVDWEGEDSHSNLARQRNNMFGKMAELEPAQWYMQADDDGLPGDDYFHELEDFVHFYNIQPVLLTGSLINLDGQRYWDVAQWHHEDNPPTTPTLLPYDNWHDDKYSHGIYFNGNQHILNRKGFELGVKYREFAAEDTWFAGDFLKAGGLLDVNPEMKMQLLRMHGHLGHKSFRDCTCEVMYNEQGRIW